MSRKRFTLASAIGALILSTSISSNASTVAVTANGTNPSGMTTTDSYSIDVSNVTYTNNGIMTDATGNQSRGFFYLGTSVTQNTKLINNGNIILSYGTSAIAINNSNNSNTQTFLNNGLISVSGNIIPADDKGNNTLSGIKMNTVNGGINSSTGEIQIIQNNGTSNIVSMYGIVYFGGSFINDGKITLTGSGIGIQENAGISQYAGYKTSVTTALNNGEISISKIKIDDTVLPGNSGLVAGIETVSYKSGTSQSATNNKKITISDSIAPHSEQQYGIAGMVSRPLASGSGSGVTTLVNNGTITINNSEYSAGMQTISQQRNDTTKLINTGIININANNSKGMSGNLDATFSNTGAINMIGDNNEGMDTYLSSFINEGTININGTNSYGVYVGKGRDFTTTTIVNQAFDNQSTINIDGSSIGIYSISGGEVKNTGTITVVNGGTGARIENGNFYNSGTVSATGQNAIIMDGTNQVLELGNGTNIDGLTDGGAGEDTIVLSGGTINVGTEAINFEKIVTTANSTLSGTVNLNVSDFSDYATTAFGTSSTPSYVWNDAAGAPGVLTVVGTVNIDVDYDGISSTGTNKTGKIIANDVVISGGNLVLQNGGTTTNSIQNEVISNDPSATEFYVNDVLIVSTTGKAQAVDPGLFTLGTGMTGGLDTNGNNWSTYTAQTFGSTNGSGSIGQRYYINNTPAPEVIPEPSYIIIPRNRVDLDNANQLQKTNLTAVNFNSEHMEKGEKKLSFDYQGTVLSSDFDAEKEYNYDYDVKSNGFSGTLVHKITDRWTTGVSLGYSNSFIDYKGINAGGTVYGDSDHEEQINSFNGAILGRYTKEKWDFDANLGIGFNVHKLNTDFVGQGIRKGEYYSHLLKGGLAATYNKEFEDNNIQLLPTVGIEYNNVNEDAIYYDATSSYSSIKIDEAKKGGLTGKVEVKVKENEGKFRWDAGVGYKYNFVDTFHEDRYVSGTDLKMEKLHYAKGTIMANANVSYVPNDKIAFNLGYNYEKNKNFENSMIKAGFTINLNETK